LLVNHPFRVDPRYAGVALVALGHLGVASEDPLVAELLKRAAVRSSEAYTRDLARIAHVGGVFAVRYLLNICV